MMINDLHIYAQMIKIKDRESHTESDADMSDPDPYPYPTLRIRVQNLDGVPMSLMFEIPESDTRIRIVSDTPYPSY